MIRSKEEWELYKAESMEKMLKKVIDDVEDIRVRCDVLKHNMGLVGDAEYKSYLWFCDGIIHYLDGIANITKQLQRKIRKENKG